MSASSPFGTCNPVTTSLSHLDHKNSSSTPLILRPSLRQVLDWKRFKPGQSLQAGLFWVAEQIPHLIEAADMTETLAWGYWPSYNVPYFPEVLILARVLSCRQGVCMTGSPVILPVQMAKMPSLLRHRLSALCTRWMTIDAGPHTTQRTWLAVLIWMHLCKWDPANGALEHSAPDLAMAQQQYRWTGIQIMSSGPAREACLLHLLA